MISTKKINKYSAYFKVLIKRIKQTFVVVLCCSKNKSSFLNLFLFFLFD
jgi:hypothetical protein